MTLLQHRIDARDARVVIMGAGYVGLPLSVEAASAGFAVTAFDINPERVDALNRGQSHVADVSEDVLSPLIADGKLRASTDPDVLLGADVIVICVPTPLNKTKDPDNSFIIAATEFIVPRMRSSQLIILESTTFPGFTREVLLPRLAASGLRHDQDFFVAFSPERVDPGNTRFVTRNTPKVVGGGSPTGLSIASTFYRAFVDQVVPVTSTDAAEMVKLLENTYRAVNIGLVNEVAMMCRRLDLDPWEVIEAAATKPFGFTPFFPGPGLGGHCIPVDPLYLSWKLRTLKYDARFIELADEINRAMPGFVVQRIADALNARKQTLNGARLLICGVTYKRDVPDLRESPALDIIELLHEHGSTVDYADPYVPELEVSRGRQSAVPLTTAGAYDCVVIVADHSRIDYAALVRQARLVVDCRNVTREARGSFAEKIVTL